MAEALATRAKNCPRSHSRRRRYLAERWYPNDASDDSCWLCAQANLAELEAGTVLRILKFGLGETTEARWGYLVASEGAVSRVRPELNELLVGTVLYLILLWARQACGE
jgi:hypothetical protein